MEEKNNSEERAEEAATPAANNNTPPSAPETLPGLPRPLREHINAVIGADGNTYLHELCRRAAPLALIEDAVLELGADPDILNRNNMPALALAILHADAAVIEGLVRLGASCMLPPFNAALMAVEANKPEALAALLRQGGGIGLNQPGLTSKCAPLQNHALHVAIEERRHEMIESLIAAGSFVNVPRASDGLLPLHIAARRFDPDVADLLMACGADPDGRTAEGQTPLHVAAHAGRLPLVEALIRAGADVNAQDNRGRTPLMIAAEECGEGVVRALAAAGADVNHQAAADGNRTALMLAVRRNHSDVVKTLLELGADTLLQDSFNQQAMSYVHPDDGRDVLHMIKTREDEQLRDSFERAHRRAVQRQTGGKPPSFGA